MKKIAVPLLRVIYIAAIISWIILACVFRLAETKAGIAVLEAIMMAGFGAWIAQNYCDWRLER